MADIEDDWVALGRPGKVEQVVKKTREKSQSLLTFLFSWVSRAWTAWWGIFLGWKFHAALALDLAIVGSVLFIYKAATADGKVDYCYLDQDSSAVWTEYRLMGHRAWRRDAILRSVNSSDKASELTDLATKIDCPMGIKR